MGKNLSVCFLIVVSLCLLASCGGVETVDSLPGEESENGEAGDESSGEGLEGGAVTEVVIDPESGTGVVELTNVSSSQNYILALYSYNSAGVTDAYEVGQSSQVSARALLTLADEGDEDLTEDLHQWLREEEEFLDDSYLLNPAGGVNGVTRGLKGDSKASGASTRTFKVLKSFSTGGSYTTVTATLRYEGSSFRIYVDQRNGSSLTDEDIGILAADFESVVDEERSFFGTESDIDSDGKFNVLMTQAVNELGGSAGGFVTGFFYAVDLFSASKYAQSNETEVINTFVPDPSGAYGTPVSKAFAMSNILPGVIPHEFQHMINFNMHYNVNKGSPEISFLNEGLAHQAEDIYSLDASGYMQSTGLENPARISGYLDSIDTLCIVCGASLYQRGGSYLMVRYLYEQAQKGNLPAAATGADLLQRLLNTSKTGVDNIVNAAYGEVASVEGQFRTLLGQYSLAVFMDGTGLSSDDRFEINGIDLRGAQSDNRGTVLQGPAVNSLSSNSFTSTIGGASVSYVEITGDDISSLGGTLEVQVSDQAGIGAFLIQTGL